MFCFGIGSLSMKVMVMDERNYQSSLSDKSETKEKPAVKLSGSHNSTFDFIKVFVPV